MDIDVEYEASLFNESKQKKRDSDVAENEEKRRKRRRSSLASTRRSITGIFQPDLDSGSDKPSSSCSPTSSGGQNELITSNPLNVRMDEIIQDFEANISRLDHEYSLWKLVLKNLENEQEQTKLLSESNMGINAEDIPQELKDLAKSEYISTELIDYNALESRLEKSFMRKYFNIEKCLHDMKLLRGCLNTIKSHNKWIKATRLNQMGDSDLGVAPEDLKVALEWMMKN